MHSTNIELLKEYYSTVFENVQTFKNQAVNSLKRNGVDDAEKIASDLEKIINDTKDIPSAEFMQYNTLSNIPILAMIYVGYKDVRQVQHDYEMFLKLISSPYRDLVDVGGRRAYPYANPSMLIDFFDNIINELKTKNLTISFDKAIDGENKKKYEQKIGIIETSVEKLHDDLNKRSDALRKAEGSSNFKSSSENLQENDDTVYSDENIIVYLADSPEKTKKYGCNSGLCISTGGYQSFYYKYRLGLYRNDSLGMTTYFVYWKNGSNRILIDALGDEDGPAEGKYSWNPIESNSDSDTTEEQLVSKFPVLKPAFNADVFKFLPYNERENKAYHIYQNVSSVDELIDDRDDIEVYEDIMAFIGVGKPIMPDSWDKIKERFSKE